MISSYLSICLSVYLSIYLPIYLSIDVYLVALIIVFPFFTICCRVGPGKPSPCQNLQKSIQNPSKNLPKSSQNRPRTLPEPSQIRSKIPSVLQKRSEHDFFNFLSIFGGPWASQNRAKIAKIWKKALKNRCQKNTCFSTAVFLDFSPFWPPKTTPKSTFF